MKGGRAWREWGRQGRGDRRRGEEHKDRGRETVKQRIEMVSALSL